MDNKKIKKLINQLSRECMKNKISVFAMAGDEKSFAYRVEGEVVPVALMLWESAKNDQMLEKCILKVAALINVEKETKQ